MLLWLREPSLRSNSSPPCPCTTPPSFPGNVSPPIVPSWHIPSRSRSPSYFASLLLFPAMFSLVCTPTDGFPPIVFTSSLRTPVATCARTSMAIVLGPTQNEEDRGQVRSRGGGRTKSKNTQLKKNSPFICLRARHILFGAPRCHSCKSTTAKDKRLG